MMASDIEHDRSRLVRARRAYAAAAVKDRRLVVILRRIDKEIADIDLILADPHGARMEPRSKRD